MNQEQLLRKVADSISHIDLPHTVRVGIDGIDAAGKSTFAGKLHRTLTSSGVPVIRASIDDFHNPATVRYSKGRFSPHGYYQDSFDHPVIISHLLRPLGPSGDGTYRLAAYDYQADQERITSTRIAPEHAILLFDGIFLSRPELTQYWDLIIFLDITFDECLSRALDRDGEKYRSADLVRECYQKRYIPSQRLYLAECQPKKGADILINNEDPLAPKLVRIDLPASPGKISTRTT